MKGFGTSLCRACSASSSWAQRDTFTFCVLRLKMAKFLQLCSAPYLRGYRLILTITLRTFQELYHDTYSLESYHSLTLCLFRLLASPGSEFPACFLFPAVTINFKQCLIIKSTYIEPGSCLKERLLLLFFYT